MSKYGLIYQLQFDQKDSSTQITVDIADASVIIPDDNDTVIISLTPAGTPLIIELLNNERDKHFPVRSKQATIRFLSDRSQGIDATTFMDAPDNNWFVRIYNELGTDIFKGFLSTRDLQEPFLPDPQEVVLTATDMLGMLKTIPWTDFDGAFPVGKYKLGVIIAHCLSKTGMELPIRVINNLRHGSGTVTLDAQFVASNNTIIVTTDEGYFYPGQLSNVVGSSVNDLLYHITGVADGSGTKILTVDEDIVTNEGPIPITFMDLSSLTHFYDAVLVDAYTFEQQIGTMEDCYTVLSKILGEDCFLGQYKGEWYIYRVDEFDNDVYIGNFTAAGVFTGMDGAITLDKNIGAGEAIVTAGYNRLMESQVQHESIKETYNYNLPEELPCNVDFERGDDIDVTDPADSRYEVECWNMVRNLAQPVTSDAFIRRVFETGYERQRYVVITPAANSATPWNYLKSEPIPIGEGDKVTISVDWRWSADASGGAVTYHPLLLYMVGISGYWQWWHPSSTDEADFFWTGPNASEFDRYIPVNFNLSDTDMTEWKTLTVELDPAPEDGLLYIGLLHMNQSGSGFDDVDAHYTNLRVDINSYINGGYAEYSGQYSKVTGTDAGYLTRREKEVFISDSPKPVFKGAMFVQGFTLGDYLRVVQFWAAAPFAMGNPPSSAEMIPYGKLQAFSVWNQYNLGFRIFSGSMEGIGEQWPDLVHRYLLTDANANTNNRRFMLISFSQDWRTGLWSGVVVEVHNTAVGKSYDDPFEFRYISSRGR